MIRVQISVCVQWYGLKGNVLRGRDMRLIYLICWLLLFLLCNLGYWEYFQKILKIDTAYYPSLAVMFIITVLFLAGILNFLKEASMALWLLGLLYLGKRIWEERSLKFLLFYCKPVFLTLLLFTIAFFVACYGKELREYDNFTHWGLVVKQMVTENHFPDYRDSTILFQTYPLGTAVYLYFGLSFPGLGMAEDMAMFLQAHMMACFVMALYSRGNKNLSFATAFIDIAMIFFVSVSLGILDLRVDVVLGLATGCTLLYVWDYCLKETDTPEFWLGACYMAALSQIKNSAMLMVLICSGGIFWTARRDRRYVQRGFLALSPVATWFLWRKHYGNVYAAAINSYHAMTLSNYKQTFFDNPISKISQIAAELLRFAFTFHKTIACVLCFLLVGLLVAYIWKENKILLKRAAIFSACFYGTYMIFLLAMYVFSMGTVESEGLPSAARYTNTALFVINYVLCALCVRTISRAKLREKKQLAGVIVLLLLLPARMLLCGERPTVVLCGKQIDAVRQEMRALIAENQIPYGSQCCILVPEGDNGLYCFKLRYTLMSGSVRQVFNANAEDLEAINEQYVFVYDTENSAILEWLADGGNPNVTVLASKQAT